MSNQTYLMVHSWIFGVDESETKSHVNFEMGTFRQISPILHVGGYFGPVRDYPGDKIMENKYIWEAEPGEIMIVFVSCDTFPVFLRGPRSSQRQAYVFPTKEHAELYLNSEAAKEEWGHREETALFITVGHSYSFEIESKAVLKKKTVS